MRTTVTWNMVSWAIHPAFYLLLSHNRSKQRGKEEGVVLPYDDLDGWVSFLDQTRGGGCWCSNTQCPPPQALLWWRMKRFGYQGRAPEPLSCFLIILSSQKVPEMFFWFQVPKLHLSLFSSVLFPLTEWEILQAIARGEGLTYSHLVLTEPQGVGLGTCNWIKWTLVINWGDVRGEK